MHFIVIMNNFNILFIINMVLVNIYLMIDKKINSNEEIQNIGKKHKVKITIILWSNAYRIIIIFYNTKSIINGHSNIAMTSKIRNKKLLTIGYINNRY